MEIIVCGKPEEWDQDKLEAERTSANAWAARQAEKDFDDAWLTQWAANTTVHKLHLIEQLLAKPEETFEEPYHCGQALREVQTQYGILLRCRICEFKVSYRTYLNWKDGRGRRNLGDEGLVMTPETHRLGLTMNANGIFYVVREHYARTAPQYNLYGRAVR